MNRFEQIKSKIGARVDRGIQSVNDFLNKEKVGLLEVQPDPLDTGKFWFVKLSYPGEIMSATLAVAIDTNKVIAKKIMRHIAMILMISGYAVQPEEEKEFEFSPTEMDMMKSLDAIFFDSDTVKINNEYSERKKEFVISLVGDNDALPFLTLCSITSRGSWIIAKQLVMLFSAMEHHILFEDDETLCNRYGIVDFAPLLQNSEKMNDEKP